MSDERKSRTNPPGFVPFFGQGLVAKEFQLGATGTKSWLKTIKLHKYWPLISHWSYWQMMALTKENMDYNIKIVGGTGITEGAQGKLLRSIQELRERRSKLMNIIDCINNRRQSLFTELSYIQMVIHTPLPTSETDSLPILIVYVVQHIKDYIAQNGNTSLYNGIMQMIDEQIKLNPVLKLANKRLKKEPLLWHIESTVTMYAASSSRVLGNILNQQNWGSSNGRTRNISVDSGFEEYSNNSSMSTRNFLSIWPPGINSIMFPSPRENEEQSQLLRSLMQAINKEISRRKC